MQPSKKTFWPSLNSAGPQGSIEYYPEYLESNRFPGDDQEAVLHAYLKQKYARRHIDVVSRQPIRRCASCSNTATTFFRIRQSSLASVRLLTEGIRDRGGLTGVINTFSFKQTLDLALGLHPDTKQVFIVSGTLDHSKLYETMARERLQGYDSRVSLTYLTDLSPQNCREDEERFPIIQ
jgi:hypothetical protein